MTVSTGSGRVAAVDALRGFVMVIMALDHVRDFFHAGALAGVAPDDLSKTTVALFFTRWVTHFCAPVFAFTAGLGAYLWMARGRSTSELSRHLWSRGVWLVLLDLTVLRGVMFLGWMKGPVIVSVLWSLGWSMVLLAVLVRWTPVHVIGALGVGVIALGSLAAGQSGWGWNLLLVTGVLQVKGIAVVTAYPVLPWAGLMAAGYWCGQVAGWEPERRRHWLWRAGWALTAGYVVLRLINGYGDPQPWAWQANWVWTVLSFLRTTKYAPSFQFVLMTMGPALLIWRWMEGRNWSARNPLIVFGRAPLFYFLAHFAVIQVIAFLFARLHYGRADFLWELLPSLGGSGTGYPAGYGYSLPVVYAVWVLVVVAMYWPCVWFARWKAWRRVRAQDVGKTPQS